MGKLIKDVVHGYIEFDQEYIDIINSAEFQRLRNVRQTSYHALYPSSLHDRFSHSLGVYFLGKFAFDNFKVNVNNDFHSEETNNINWDRKRGVFLRACLLHDIGHAPFSHTGENFYLHRVDESSDLSRNNYIYSELVRTVGLDSFKQDFNLKQLNIKNNAAKPHEIMSAIIGIKSFLNDSPKEDKDLFARMIIGLIYDDKTTIEQGINNSLIQLLNSSVIDVDRLDYLSRDRLMTGFESARIDTERLLSNVCLINDSTDKENPSYRLGFYKNALSIIESVVIEHDGEKKWIQGQAIIQYDSFLIRKIIEGVENEFGKMGELFCEEALSDNGIQIPNKITGESVFIKSLCDADILFLARQIKSPEYKKYVDEYFNRNSRKKAIWKTETEYDLMLRELGEADLKRVVEWFDSFVGAMNVLFDVKIEEDGVVIINDDIQKKIEKIYSNKINNLKKRLNKIYRKISRVISKMKLQSRRRRKNLL